MRPMYPYGKLVLAGMAWAVPTLAVANLADASGLGALLILLAGVAAAGQTGVYLVEAEKRKTGVSGRPRRSQPG